MYWPWYIFKNTLIIIKHPDLWKMRDLTVIKYPGESSLKSYCNLLVVKSRNYYLDRLTADVYEGNFTYDVCNSVCSYRTRQPCVHNNRVRPRGESRSCEYGCARNRLLFRDRKLADAQKSSGNLGSPYFVYI